MKKIVLIFSIFIFYNCSGSHIQLTGLPKGEKLVMEIPESTSTNCEEKTFIQWNAFFNILPLTGPTLEELFPDSSKTYRFYEKWTAKDIVLSIPLAYISTITRRSIVVESCEVGKVYALTEKELDTKVNEVLAKREEDGESVVEDYIEKAKKQNKTRVKTRIILHSGKTLVGEMYIPKQKTDYIELGVEKMVPQIVKEKVSKKLIKEID